MTKNGQNMAKMEKIRNIQMTDNKEDKFFYFPMISMPCTGAVIDGDMQSADAGQVVPICQCFLCAVVDSCVGSLVCAVAVVRVADRSFGDGDDFDDVAISHGMPFGHGVCTDIING